MAMRRFAALGSAVDAARRYARKNPDKTQSYVDKAATFVDSKTKGKYSRQIRSASDKASSVALGGDRSRRDDMIRDQSGEHPVPGDAGGRDGSGGLGHRGEAPPPPHS